jgi:hypothetical protein
MRVFGRADKAKLLRPIVQGIFIIIVVVLNNQMFQSKM